MVISIKSKKKKTISHLQIQGKSVSALNWIGGFGGSGTSSSLRLLFSLAI